MPTQYGLSVFTLAMPKPSVNVVTKRDGDTLWIGVDMTQAHGWSKTGKSIIIASTYGTTPIDNEFFNLVVFRKPFITETRPAGPDLPIEPRG